MSVPTLRFKDDEGRDFPDWKSLKLSKLANIYDGTHMTPDYTESGVPFYSVEHVTSNNFSETKFISEEVFEKENKRVKLEKGDILMTRIGDIGTPKFIDWNVRASFYVSLALIKQSKNINSQYLSQFIASSYFQKEIHQRTIHVAFPKKINLGEIGECLVSFPICNEQTKIADFLSAVDEKITQLTQKCDLLAQYKKGVTQRIFSQELCFKDEYGRDFPEWERKSLGDVATLFNGRAYKQTEWETEGVPVIRLQNLTGSSTNYYYSKIKLPENRYCNKGDLLYMWSATFGPVWWLGCKAIYHYHIWKIETDIKRLSKNYLYYVLDDITAKMKSTSNGSTMDHITKGGMEKFGIYLPHIQEQTKIANFLTAIDDKITHTQAQLKAVKQYKQGLLQQMFV